MKEWYDGYRFGNKDVYCPWDVLNYCDALLDDPDAKPQAYWNNTSSNSVVKMFIDKADATTRGFIEKLIAGESIERQLTEDLTYAEIDENIGNLWSVLYLTGYLTLERKKEADQSEYVRLVIPNKEIQTIFVDKIQKWFEEKVGRSAEKLKELYSALAHGGVKKAEKIIHLQLRNTISYYDQNESFYHGFLIGLLSGNPDWILKSNREMGMGRSDIMLEDAAGEFGIVIEIKRAGNVKELDAKCEEALRQIEDRRYAEELMDEVDNIWVYGIAFAEKKCCMKVRQVK